MHEIVHEEKSYGEGDAFTNLFQVLPTYRQELVADQKDIEYSCLVKVNASNRHDKQNDHSEEVLELYHLVMQTHLHRPDTPTPGRQLG